MNICIQIIQISNSETFESFVTYEIYNNLPKLINTRKYPTMLLRAFFGGSNKLVKTLLPIYKSKFESRLHKKSQSNLNSNCSRSLTFSTISQRLHAIDANIVQESSYIPYAEKQFSRERTLLEALENAQEIEKSSTKNGSSLNQNKSVENEPRRADEYTLNVGRGNSFIYFYSIFPNFLLYIHFFSKQFALYELICHYFFNMASLILQFIHQIFY